MNKLPVAAGRALTWYNGGALRADRVDEHHRSYIRRVQPNIMMLHSGLDGFSPASDLATFFRSLAGLSTRVWFGVGCDHYVNYLFANPNPAGETRVRDKVKLLARYASNALVEAIVWDSEPASEAHPSAGARFAEIAIQTLRTEAPHIKQAHTAYDHPCRVPINQNGYPAKPGEKIIGGKGGHLAYPWKAWRGVGGVDFGLEQTYVAEEIGTMVPPGILKRRHATSARSFEMLVEKGLQRPDLPWARYNQTWSTPMAQIVNNELQSDLWCSWAAPSATMDTQGEVAFECSVVAQRMQLNTIEKVREFQRVSGLDADGVIGPKTWAAMQQVYYAK